MDRLRCYLEAVSRRGKGMTKSRCGRGGAKRQHWTLKDVNMIESNEST